MKRVISAVVLAALMLTACGGKAENESAAAAVSSTVTEEPTGAQSAVASEVMSEVEPDPEELRLQAIKESAQNALSGVAYYGDPAVCEMTAEQAIAYAQLMADGIAGEEHYDEWTEETTIRFWEKGFSVFGYEGPYQTTRARVVLGDFAGDGNPYLYLFDAEKDNSFTIYGWKNGSVEQLWDAEDWMGRSDAYLTSEDVSQGLAQLRYSGSGGADDHMSERHAFADGALKCVSSYQEYYDYSAGCWHIIENGVDKIYTQAEYAALYDAEPAPAPKKTPPELQAYSGPSLNAVCAAPSTLREMIAVLNDYAGKLSEGAAAAVTIKEPSDNLFMAIEMLSVLDEYWEITDAALYDMDGNGKKELLVAHRNNGFFECDVYTWKNGALSKKAYGGGMVDDIGLAQNTQTGECGIFTGAYTGEAVESFSYPSGKISLCAQFDPEGVVDTFYFMYKNDDYENAIELSESEYDAQYSKHKLIREFNGSTNSIGELESVKSALRSMK